MTVLRAATRGTLIAVAALSAGGCGRDITTRLDAINDAPPSLVGRLAGVVTRTSGVPAQGLDVRALNHGVVVLGAITDGSGAFTMSFESLISQSQPGDTLLTYFIQARAMVGSTSDSLVLRESVQVRMSINRATPPITNVVLRAAY